jgi:perosamine synthetase
LISSGVEPGQAAITSPASFIASANAIIHAQAQPLFADIDLGTYTASPKQIETTITAKTKAIVPVHLYGYPADMDSINAIAERRKLIIIEDACQAHGASYHGKKSGNLGLIGCFSFYPSKNMTVCGDGGMITTNDEKIARIAAKLRDCGRKSQYVHDVIGYTSRLNTVNAAIGRVQLRHLDSWNDDRRKAAEVYNQLLSGVGDLSLPPNSSAEVFPVYHQYVVRTKYRDELKTWLESQGIGCGIHYVLPIHLQPIYQHLYGFKEGTYPVAEELCRTCLSIPIFPSISREEMIFIGEKIRDFYNTQ